MRTINSTEMWVSIENNLLSALKIWICYVVVFVVVCSLFMIHVNVSILSIPLKWLCLVRLTVFASYNFTMACVNIIFPKIGFNASRCLLSVCCFQWIIMCIANLPIPNHLWDPGSWPLYSHPIMLNSLFIKCSPLFSSSCHRYMWYSSNFIKCIVRSRMCNLFSIRYLIIKIGEVENISLYISSGAFYSDHFFFFCCM